MQKEFLVPENVYSSEIIEIRSQCLKKKKKKSSFYFAFASFLLFSFFYLSIYDGKIPCNFNSFQHSSRQKSQLPYRYAALSPSNFKSNKTLCLGQSQKKKRLAIELIFVMLCFSDKDLKIFYIFERPKPRHLNERRVPIFPIYSCYKHFFLSHS